MEPCPAILAFPAVHREIESKVRYPNGDVIVTVDHDRTAVDRRRPIFRGLSGSGNHRGAGVGGCERQGEKKATPFQQSRLLHAA